MRTDALVPVWAMVEPSFPQILLLLLLLLQFQKSETMMQALKRGGGRGAGLPLAPNVGRERSLSLADDSAVMGGVSGQQ